MTSERQIFVGSFNVSSAMAMLVTLLTRQVFSPAVSTIFMVSGVFFLSSGLTLLITGIIRKAKDNRLPSQELRLRVGAKLLVKEKSGSRQERKRSAHLRL
jgi:hypothetical protein